jgi:hypothetical protein
MLYETGHVNFVSWGTTFKGLLAWKLQYGCPSDRQSTYNVILRHFRITIFAVKRNKYCIFWVCAVALFVWHATRMRGIILSLAAYSALPYFSTLFQYWYNCWKTDTAHKICVWSSLQLLSEKSFVLRRIQRDVIINVRMFWHSSYF